MSDFGISSFDKGCLPSYSTDQIDYVGDPIPCLQICTGDSLTNLQYMIGMKLCSLLSANDLSGLVIPDCLKVAWAGNDVKQLTLFNFILQQYCVLQAQVDGQATTLSNFNPQICLDYSGAGSVCNVQSCQTLTQHLQAILDIIGQQSLSITNLQNQISQVQSTNNQLQTQLSQQATQIISLQNQIVQILNQLP